MPYPLLHLRPRRLPHFVHGIGHVRRCKRRRIATVMPCVLCFATHPGHYLAFDILAVASRDAGEGLALVVLTRRGLVQRAIAAAVRIDCTFPSRTSSWMRSSGNPAMRPSSIRAGRAWPASCHLAISTKAVSALARNAERIRASRPAVSSRNRKLPLLRSVHDPERNRLTKTSTGIFDRNSGFATKSTPVP